MGRPPKLPDVDVIIDELRREGWPEDKRGIRLVARKYGCTPSAVRQHLKREQERKEIAEGKVPERIVRAAEKRAEDRATERAAKVLEESFVSQVEVKAKARLQVVESIEEMNVRHLKELHLLQSKALDALRSMPIDDVRSAIKALTEGIKLERLVRGEPTDRTAIGVEEIIRRETERWLRIVPEAIETEAVSTDEPQGSGAADAGPGSDAPPAAAS